MTRRWQLPLLGRAPDFPTAGAGLWTTRAVPAEPPCRRDLVPKSSTACARRRPHLWLSRVPRHVLCSVRAGTETPSRPAAPVVLSLPATSEGVLPGQLLERAIRAGYIDAGRFKIPDANVQPASLDLRLGERALRIRCSFLPGSRLGRAQAEGLHPRRDRPPRATGRCSRPGARTSSSSRSGSTSRPGCGARPTPRARPAASTCSPGSSPTTATASTRWRPGYSGPLYLEVVPLSFAVRVREDLTLNQLRLSVGRPWLSDDEVRRAHLRRADPLSAGRAGARSTNSCCPTACSSASTCTATSGARWATAPATARRCST